MEAPSSDALVPERRRCPLKPWGPFGGNGFWGNPQEGASQHSHVRGRELIFFLEHDAHFERVSPETNSLFAAFSHPPFLFRGLNAGGMFAKI